MCFHFVAFFFSLLRFIHFVLILCFVVVVDVVDLLFVFYFFVSLNRIVRRALLSFFLFIFCVVSFSFIGILIAHLKHDFVCTLLACLSLSFVRCVCVCVCMDNHNIAAMAIAMCIYAELFHLWILYVFPFVDWNRYVRFFLGRSSGAHRMCLCLFDLIQNRIQMSPYVKILFVLFCGWLLCRVVALSMSLCCICLFVISLLLLSSSSPSSLSCR